MFGTYRILKAVDSGHRESQCYAERGQHAANHPRLHGLQLLQELFAKLLQDGSLGTNFRKPSSYSVIVLRILDRSVTAPGLA